MHHGKQHHPGHGRGRQFAQGFEQYLIAQDTRALIERLRVERMP